MIWMIYTAILGIGLIVFGILDGIKYLWLSQAIKKQGIAKGQSRKFINVALGKDIWIALYLLTVKPDNYLLVMTLIGFVFTIELFWTVYQLYPYRGRGLQHFKKPSLWKYFINSLQPNSKRRRL